MSHSHTHTHSEPVEAPDASRCAHFGECGGCASQDVPYALQLERKEEALRELFALFWTDRIPVEPSPQAWHYRNKIDLTFGQKFYDQPPPKDFERETVLGFKRKGQWFRPLEIEECRIFSPDLPPLLASVRGWAREAGLKAFHARRDEGLLRILLLREGKRTGQRMVVLITRHEDFDRDGFVRAVRRAWDPASIQWGVFSGKADIAAADRVEVLHGAPTIEERLHVPTGGMPRDLRFVLSPFSFFQTNTLGTERLYGFIREWVEACPPEVLYDLYGGSGGIALACADLAGRVVSVENFEAASVDGVLNAERNGAGNVSFVTQEVEGYLRDRLKDGEFDREASVIVDPPRAGLHPKALRRLVELRPRRLLYVSCKPSVLAGELSLLLEAYRLTGLRAVDLFPHTPHAEVLATFEALPDSIWRESADPV